MEYLTERITISDDLCNGKPTIRGMRITVESILGYLSAGDKVEDIIEAFPILEEADIYACMDFASKLMNRSFVIKPVA